MLLLDFCMCVIVGDVFVDLISDCLCRLNPCIWCNWSCGSRRLLLLSSMPMGHYNLCLASTVFLIQV